MANTASTGPARPWPLIALGAATACLGAFPAAALVALVYGFPIPFGGKPSGPAAMAPAMLAVIFYGALGGFVPLAAAGAGAAAYGIRSAGGDRRKARRVTVILALGASLAAAVALAVLDLIIGPW